MECHGGHGCRGLKQLHGAQLWPHGVWCCARGLPRGWFDVRLPHAARLPPVPRGSWKGDLPARLIAPYSRRDAAIKTKATVARVPRCPIERDRGLRKFRANGSTRVVFASRPSSAWGVLAEILTFR
ncbi:hypothetical protein K0M31_007494 [Melipona bicolor]|uniref:Uncharacterized protein n=1 Tax=Melipona bicolor TaxID=60889 RepID=A0AA40KVU9_9HYME|nr:hypothetical protein K0M31_007494 [Melipona bicolor]